MGRGVFGLVWCVGPNVGERVGMIQVMLFQAVVGEGLHGYVRL